MRRIVVLSLLGLSAVSPLLAAASLSTPASATTEAPLSLDTATDEEGNMFIHVSELANLLYEPRYQDGVRHRPSYGQLARAGNNFFNFHHPSSDHRTSSEGKRTVMAKRFDPYTKRFDPMDKRFDPMDKRFDPMDKRFDPMDKRFDPMDKRFDPMDKRFDPMDKRFDPMDKRFDPYTKRFDPMDKRFDPMDKRFDPMDKRFDPMDKRSNMLRREFELQGFYPEDI